LRTANGGGCDGERDRGNQDPDLAHGIATFLVGTASQ
jgi:hypothetical protein